MSTSHPARVRRPLRIVIVEDEALVALEMEAHLVEVGHEVVGIADTLVEAVELVEAERPDLALVDIQLADGSNGVDVVKALRTRGIHCLFATGNCPGQQRSDAIGCLHKPYSHVHLIRAVDAAEAVIQGGRPTHLPAQMHLYRAGE
jgi:two-component system, response regulator PdtaR